MSQNNNPIAKRILLKISGESFKGNKDNGIDPKSIDYMAREIKKIEKIKRSERFKTKKKSLLSRIIETFKFK